MSMAASLNIIELKYSGIVGLIRDLPVVEASDSRFLVADGGRPYIEKKSEACTPAMHASILVHF